MMKVIALTCLCIAIVAAHTDAKNPPSTKAAATTKSPTTTKGPTTTEAPKLCNRRCPSPLPEKAVLLPGEACDEYCLCDPRGAVLRLCPIFNNKTGERLHFNPKTLVCDWPENVGCE